MDDDHSDAENFSALTGLVLTAAILYFAFELAPKANIPARPYPYVADAFHSLFARAVVGSLTLLNVGLTFYLMAKSAGSGRLFAFMWCAPLAAAMAYPVLVARDKAERVALERAHPSISEYHFNLSERTFWLAPVVSEPSIKPGKSGYAHREQTLENRADSMEEYAGERLAPGFKRMQIFFSEPNGRADVMKRVQAGPWQDRSLIYKFDGSGLSTSRTYHYFHYSDRVEVVPTFGSVSSPENRRTMLKVPLLDVYPHNLTAVSIARLQIDGKEIGLEGVLAPDDEKDCKIESRPAVNMLAAPLEVRWQNAQSGAAWREASVSVPPFRQSRPGKDVVRSNAVHLYFQADGSVAAQRVQEIIVGEELFGVRVTEPAPALKTQGVCGTAATAYPETVERMGN